MTLVCCLKKAQTWPSTLLLFCLWLLVNIKNAVVNWAYPSVDKKQKLKTLNFTPDLLQIWKFFVFGRKEIGLFIFRMLINLDSFIFICKHQIKHRHCFELCMNKYHNFVSKDVVNTSKNKMEMKTWWNRWWKTFLLENLRQAKQESFKDTLSSWRKNQVLPCVH